MGSQMDILLVGVVIVGVLYMNGSFKGLMSSKMDQRVDSWVNMGAYYW